MLNTLLSSGLLRSWSFGARAGLSISLFALANAGRSQINLVPNWSFEDTAYCDMPTQWPIQKAPPWFSANYATPDVYSMDGVNPCGVYMDTTDLIGSACYQDPFHGNRFAGEYVWKTGSGLKEYMQVKLVTPLQAGHAYRVAMEISLPECWNYAMDLLGAYFAPDTVFDPTLGIPGVLPVVPQAQFHDPSFYTDTVNWMHLEDTIVAVGGEEFMVIGSFVDNSTASVLYVPGGPPNASSYYYFDAVVVEDIGGIEAIEEITIVEMGSGTLILNWPERSIDRVMVYTLTGQVVAVRPASRRETVQLDLPKDLPRGTYVLAAWSESDRATAKWMKME